MKSAFALSSFVLFACACAAPADIPEGDAVAGEGLYTTHCASCHGGDAKSGSAGENLVEEVGEEDEFFNVVVAGKDNGAMPAFGDELSDQEIADIMAWVATL